MHNEPTLVFDWQDLSERLIEALGDEVDEHGSPAWVRVFADAGSASGMSVDSTGEPGSLIGWTAPPHCLAVGTVATGTLRSVPDGAALSRVRMCCVVGRDGGIGWTLQPPGSEPSSSPPEAGRVLDCLRRCLGLPTPAPESTAGRLQAVAWVASVLDEAHRSVRPLTWSDVARLHPLARLLSGSLAATEALAEGGLLGDLIRSAANAWSWEEIRREAVAGNLPGLADARLAEWMDEGMFSRWLLELLPSTELMLAALRPYLAPSATRRLAGALGGLA